MHRAPYTLNGVVAAGSSKSGRTPRPNDDKGSEARKQSLGSAAERCERRASGISLEAAQRLRSRTAEVRERVWELVKGGVGEPHPETSVGLSFVRDRVGNDCRQRAFLCVSLALVNNVEHVLLD